MANRSNAVATAGLLNKWSHNGVMSIDAMEFVFPEDCPWWSRTSTELCEAAAMCT
jgi:hypothetical protein